MKFGLLKTFSASAVMVLGLFAAHPCYSNYADVTDESNVVVAEDVYDFKMNLDVPQVLNNSSSLGERKFQPQIISGYFYVLWHKNGDYSFDFDSLKNKRFKVGGSYVTYKAYIDEGKTYPRFSWIGNNRTGEFKMPTLVVSFVFEPSYAIGGVDEDNSFYLTFSGKGQSILKNGSRIAKLIQGKTSGTQGCGCSAYGHLSPTRVAGINGPTTTDTDVVETCGAWIIRWKKRVYYR